MVWPGEICLFLFREEGNQAKQRPCSTPPPALPRSLGEATRGMFSAHPQHWKPSTRSFVHWFLLLTTWQIRQHMISARSAFL